MARMQYLKKRQKRDTQTDTTNDAPENIKTITPKLTQQVRHLDLNFHIFS